MSVLYSLADIAANSGDCARCSVDVEKLPEGVYLATSDDVQGLVAQGRTMSETIEIARDVARRIFEAQTERDG